MALIVCPECKAKISEYAESCPHCGCPMKVIVKLIVEQEKSAITTEQSDFTEVATTEKRLHRHQEEKRRNFAAMHAGVSGGRLIQNRLDTNPIEQ